MLSGDSSNKASYMVQEDQREKVDATISAEAGKISNLVIK